MLIAPATGSIARNSKSQVIHAAIMTSWTVDRPNKDSKITPDLSQSDRPFPGTGLVFVLIEIHESLGS
jgi:hypothetical protein